MRRWPKGAAVQRPDTLPPFSSAPHARGNTRFVPRPSSLDGSSDQGRRLRMRAVIWTTPCMGGGALRLFVSACGSQPDTSGESGTSSERPISTTRSPYYTDYTQELLFPLPTTFCCLAHPCRVGLVVGEE